ncbi:Uncharacterized protein OBRU01_18342 [Operophtera brumata]|uniref:Ketoreductase domain-containing protein n=1 Tax=Operophtera brumata TaxID=104452 RepID=A0A0L7KZ86_OPEBR|nr:Uncharacterized protein OBRU01_18342 [Operophtera brumata]
MSFRNKVVLVTGASSGIGASTAVAFAAEGARVAIVGRNEKKLAITAGKCEQKGSKSLIIAADVTKDEDVKRILEDTINHFGKLDILVNNAGIAPNASILAPETMETFDATMSTNLRSVVYLTHLAAPYLVESKGNIVNVSSVAGLAIVTNNRSAYAASKAGLDHFTRCVAFELAAKGVRVNTVNPGPVRTDIMEADGITDEQRDAMLAGARVPLGRVGEPEEIADVILFLASDKARSVTGSSYVSDNGMVMSVHTKMSLVNKVAVVTGASSGIGAAIAIKLAGEGVRVAIVGRNEKKLKAISETCEKRGFKPLVIVADVTKDEDAKKIISETLNFFGKLDILVNNAGIANSASILDAKAMEVYDKVVSTNLRSTVHFTHLAAKYLIETKGNIVNISSIAASTVLSKTSFSYCTSKAGVDHFTRCIALELAASGVRVNAINPGPVKTDIIENTGVNDAVSKHIWEVLRKATVLGRIADAEEIADLVAFLASDKARSITGSTITTDNGSSLLGPWSH